MFFPLIGFIHLFNYYFLYLSGDDIKIDNPNNVELIKCEIIQNINDGFKVKSTRKINKDDVIMNIDLKEVVMEDPFWYPVKIPWRLENKEHYENLLSLTRMCYRKQHVYFINKLKQWDGGFTITFDITTLTPWEKHLFHLLGDEAYELLKLQIELFEYLQSYLNVYDYIDLLKLKRCWGIVRTRAFYSPEFKNVIIPYFDYLNHNSDKGWDVYFQNGVYHLKVLDDYLPGEEIFGNYGKKTNAEFLILYDFIPKKNKYNTKLDRHQQDDILHHLPNVKNKYIKELLLSYL